MPTLRDYLESVLLERECTPQYAEGLRYRIDLYSQHLGRTATLDDLTPDAVNGWVKALQDSQNYKPTTIRHYREAVLTLWRAAFDRGDLASPPWRIRRVKVPQAVVQAWTLEEIRQLLDSIGILRGSVPETEIRKRDWMRAYIHLGYCTGLRRVDLMNWAKWTDIHEGIISLCQHKTAYVVSRRITERAMDALMLVRPKSEFILPWPGDKRRFFESFGRLVRAAGIRQGGPKMLRRSAGSHVEKLRPGTGGFFLGHRDKAVFDRSYHDRSISANVPDPPPEL